MYIKRSCRECGGGLTPMSVCLVYKEHASWQCDSCGNSEDSIHLRVAGAF